MKFVTRVLSQVSLLIVLISVESQSRTTDFTTRVENLNEKPITILDWLLGFTSRNVSRNTITPQTTNNNNPSSNRHTTTVVYAHEDFDNYSVSALAGGPQNIPSSVPENTNQSHSQNITENLQRVGRQYFPPSRRRYPHPHPPITVIRNPGLVDYDSSNWPVPAPAETETEPTFNLYWNTNDVKGSGRPAQGDKDHNDFNAEEETQYNSDIEDPDPEVPVEDDTSESDDYNDTSPSHYNSAHWKDTNNGRTRLKPNENNCTNSSCRLDTIEQGSISHLQTGTVTASHKTKGPNDATGFKINSKQAEPTGQENPDTTTFASPTVSANTDMPVPNTTVSTPTTTFSDSTESVGTEAVTGLTSSDTTATAAEVSNVTMTTTTSPFTTVPIDPEVPTEYLSTTTTLPSTITSPSVTNSTTLPSSSTETISSTTTTLRPETEITTTTTTLRPETEITTTTTTLRPGIEITTTTTTLRPETDITTTTTTLRPETEITTTTTTLRPEIETTQSSVEPSTGSLTTPTTVTVPTTIAPSTETIPATITTPLPTTNPQPTVTPVPTDPLKPLPEASLQPPLNTESPIITDPTTLPSESPSVQAESTPTTSATISQTDLVTEPGLSPVTNSPPPEPQITEPSIVSESPITDPPIPPNTDLTTEPIFTDPPTEPTFTDPPTEPIFTDPPTEPAFTDPPTEPTFTDPPTEPIFTDPPTEPSFTDPPTEPIFTDPPTEPSFTDSPTEPTFTDPPPELPFTETPLPTDPPFTDPPTIPTFTDLPPTEPPIIDPTAETSSATIITTDQPGSTDTTTMKPMKPPPPFNATLRCQCGVQSVSAHTVGNTLIRLHTNPWLVEISVRGRHRCAGTLINDRYVLTTASCVRRIQRKSDLTVSSGLQSKSPVQHSVSKIAIHPKYDFKTMSNNVAVLRIRDPIEPGPSARPICLPFTNPHSKYDTASLSTWIYNANNTRGRLSVLQSDVQLVNKTTCQSALNMTDSSPNRVGNGTFCAEAPSQKTCLGDTGGPLQAYVGKFSYEQIGLVSWGVGCRSSGLPGVYSMVRPYIRWMLFQMRDGRFCRERRPKQKDLLKFFELEDQI